MQPPFFTILVLIFSSMFSIVFFIHYWQIAQKHKAPTAVWAGIGFMAYMITTIIFGILCYVLEHTFDLSYIFEWIQQYNPDKSEDIEIPFYCAAAFSLLIITASYFTSKYAINRLIELKYEKEKENLLDENI